MPVLISSASGNLTASGSWSLVDSASYNNSEAANTALTTSSVASSTFVPAAVGVGAVAVKLASRVASPSGTITIELFNSTAASVALTLTVNVADLPLATVADNQGGWIVFKFGSTVTPNGTDSYSVRARTSVAAQVNLYSSATTNWSRALRTTTNQAPAAGDDMIVAGELTGAGTGNDIAVTMNQTAATDYGSNSTSAVLPAIAVCKRGALAYGTAASTNYLLQLSGHLIVYGGGTFSLGATGAEMPRNSTAILQFDCAADNDFGLIARNESVCSLVGLSRTVGKDVSWCLLNTDEAVNSTSLGVDTDTGWLDNDVIVVASTIKPGAVQSEVGAMNGNAGASTLTVDGFAGAGGGLAFAHFGGDSVSSAQTVALNVGSSVTVKMQAEVINLTRNVKLRGVTAGQMTFLSSTPTAQVTLQWAEFTLIGGSASTTGKRGVECDTSTSGFLDVRFCSFHDSEIGGLTLFPSTTASYNAQILNNVFYKASVASSLGSTIYVITPKTGGASWVIDSNVIIDGSGYGIRLGDMTGWCTNNRIIGQTGNAGMNFNHSSTVVIDGRLDGNVVHSCNCAGAIQYANGNWQTIYARHLRVWRNTSASADFYQGTTNPSLVVFSDLLLWGGSSGIVAAAGLNMQLSDSLIASDSVTTLNGAVFSDGGTVNILMENVVLGVPAAAGGFLRPCFTDIQLYTSGSAYQNGAKIIGRNVTMNSTVGTPEQLTADGYVSIERINGVAGNHKTWLRCGTVAIDTTIFNTASPSARLTPTNATEKLPTAPILRGLKVPVANGVAGKQVSVYVRKSVVGDGVAYNGNQPRLVVRRNSALGTTADAILATAAAAAGVWEQLTGTLPTPTDDGAFEIVVDCDGTAGWVNVDDFAAL